MKVKLDENLGSRAIERFTETGHAVVTVVIHEDEPDPQGIPPQRSRHVLLLFALDLHTTPFNVGEFLSLPVMIRVISHAAIFRSAAFGIEVETFSGAQELALLLGKLRSDQRQGLRR